MSVRIAGIVLAMLFVATSSEAAAQQIAVVRGAKLAATGRAAAAEANAYADRVTLLLRRMGVAVRRIDDTALTDAALAPYVLILLPRNRLDEADVAVLERFAARGGRWIAFRTEGPPALDRLFGAIPRESAPTGSAAQIDLEPEATPFRPTSLAIGSFVARWVDAAPGAQVIGAWTIGGVRHPAILRAPGGTYVAGLLTQPELEPKARFLLSEIAYYQPEILVEAYGGLRAEIQAALARAAERWSQHRRNAAWSGEERAARDRRFVTLRARLPAATPPAESATRYAAIAEALQLLADVRLHSASLTPPRDGEIRAVWHHFYAPQDWETIMRQLRDHGFNAIFARMGRGGNVTYPSDFIPRDPWADAIDADEMRRAIAAARKYGIQFHAWRVNFHMGSAPRAFYDRMAAEDRLVRDPQGNPSFWLNPGDPRNLEHEFQAMLEMVRKYDVDGIHFDYIRYPDDPHYEFDYGPVSRREFERHLGRPVTRWPEDVISGSLKQAYEDWERENINRLVERVSRETKRLKPWVQVSAAVWRNHRRYRAVIKQDWPLWIERGWLDFVVPMDYTPEMDTLAATVESQVAVTRGKIPLLVGIGTWLQPTADDVVRQVEIAREQGAAGFVLFAYSEERMGEILHALHAGATSRPTVPAILGPRAEWSVPGAIVRKDAPLFVRADRPITVRARLELTSDRPERVRRIEGEVTLEDWDGRRLARLGRTNGSHLTVRFAAPAGPFRVVIRGLREYADGEERPLLLFGPTLTGVSATEWEALRAQDRPPRFAGEGRRVGIFWEGLGAANLREALAPAPGTAAAPLYRLAPDHLAACEVVILPQLVDVAELSPPAVSALRNFVERGGTLLLTHDAVGARWHPRLFPEVGTAGPLVNPTPMVVTTPDLPGMPAGTTFTYGFTDHFVIRAAPESEVLVREARANGQPVVVRGRIGRGIVILVGMLPGYGARPMTEGEVQLLRALVQAR